MLPNSENSQIIQVSWKQNENEKIIKVIRTTEA